MPEKSSTGINWNTWDPLSKKDRKGSVLRFAVILVLIIASSTLQLFIALTGFSEFTKAFDEYRYLQTEMAAPANKLLIAMKETQYQLYKASRQLSDGLKPADVEPMLHLAEQKLADATIYINEVTQFSSLIADSVPLFDFIKARFPLYTALVTRAAEEIPVSPDEVLFTLAQTDTMYGALANGIDELSMRINHRVVEMQYSLNNSRTVIRKRLINITIGAVLAVLILVLINIRFLFTPLTKIVRTSILEVNKYMKEVDRLERLSSLSRLVSGLAHEINTPIGNCITLTTHLKETAQKFGAGTADGTMLTSTAALPRSPVRSGSNLHPDRQSFAAECIYPLQMMYESLDRAAGLVRTFKFVAAAQSCGEKRTFTLAHLMNDISYEFEPLFRGKKHPAAHAGTYDRNIIQHLLRQSAHEHCPDFKQQPASCVHG